MKKRIGSKSYTSTIWHLGALRRASRYSAYHAANKEKLQMARKVVEKIRPQWELQILPVNLSRRAR